MYDPSFTGEQHSWTGIISDIWGDVSDIIRSKTGVNSGSTPDLPVVNETTRSYANSANYGIILVAAIAIGYFFFVRK